MISLATFPRSPTSRAKLDPIHSRNERRAIAREGKLVQVSMDFAEVLCRNSVPQIIILVKRQPITAPNASDGLVAFPECQILLSQIFLHPCAKHVVV